MDNQQRAREPSPSCLQEILQDMRQRGWIGVDIESLILRAVTVDTAALRAALEGWREQHARDSQELRRLCQSRDFYKSRCEALQAVQSSMRDPERKAVCDILANGATSAFAIRPQEASDA